ncbi:MAG: DUF4157 domain-containing protein [Flavobacteriaceae bacterium]|nr:DUF4157 domain-containing protein [Flavobacteriaceae bacterium]
MKRLRKKKKTSNSHENPSGSMFFPSIQTKLSVGKAGDAYEKEADTVADKVVNTKNDVGNVQKKGAEEEQLQEKPLSKSISSLQKKELPKEEEPVQKAEEEELAQKKGEEEEEALQAKGEEEEESLQAKGEEEEETLQAKGEEEEETLQQKENEEEESVQKKPANASMMASVEATLKSTKSKGKRLPDAILEEMNIGFGANFSHIKIHTDEDAIEMCEKLGAQAFTNGNHIYFNKGKFDPHSDQGKLLLAHELTHTLQQQK